MTAEDGVGEGDHALVGAVIGVDADDRVLAGDRPGLHEFERAVGQPAAPAAAAGVTALAGGTAAVLLVVEVESATGGDGEEERQHISQAKHRRRTLHAPGRA